MNQELSAKIKQSFSAMAIYKDPEKTNSVFTKTLISAFNDGDRQPNEKGLSTKSLGNFILKEVQRNGGSAQIPAYICPPGMEPFNIFTYDN